MTRIKVQAMKSAKVKQIVEDQLKPAEDFIFGFANLKGIIGKKYNGYPCGISIGKKLDNRIIDRIKDGPTLDYYNYYNQINKYLFALAGRIAIDLKKINIDSIVIKPTISTMTEEFKKYRHNLTVEISHKMVATRAGLGWIGKTDLLISPKFGPRLRLVSILINMELAGKTEPIDKSRCGKCAVCVKQCPAGAANGKLWDVQVTRDEFFNAEKCRDKCAELCRQKLNIDRRICGICIAVCPIGQKKG
jgi:epoxyqueuosine reductase